MWIVEVCFGKWLDFPIIKLKNFFLFEMKNVFVRRLGAKKIKRNFIKANRDI